jgi:hypothetical protein
MGRPRHHRDAAELLHRRGNSFVIGGDHHRIHSASRGGASIDVLDHRPSGDVGQRLAG